MVFPALFKEDESGAFRIDGGMHRNDVCAVRGTPLDLSSFLLLTLSLSLFIILLFLVPYW
jgi:hypothetical protein